jgi:hypothetical protein
MYHTQIWLPKSEVEKLGKGKQVEALGLRSTVCIAVGIDGCRAGYLSLVGTHTVKATTVKP